METEEYRQMYEVEEFHWWFASKREFVYTYLDGLDLNSRFILDVGCGTGIMSQFLEQFGKTVSIDYSLSALRFCQQRKLKRVCQGNGLQLPFQDNSFDLVTAFDILYHQWIVDDRVALKEFHRILKPQGRLLITDSAFQFLYSSHDRAVLARERYTLPTMAKRLQESGFRICKSSYTFFSTFPIVLVVRLFESLFQAQAQSNVTKPSWLVNTILTQVMKWEASLLNHISFPFGSSILVLAEAQ